MHGGECWENGVESLRAKTRKIRKMFMYFMYFRQTQQKKGREKGFARAISSRP